MNFDQVEGFPPIEQQDAHILILGSAPSVASLQQQQYYAHPRNSFWPILTTLLVGEAVDLPYHERAALLQQHHIALWDVMSRCERPGSLDSAIAPQSITPNPFEAFLQAHPKIGAIFFNGGKAEEVYRKRVMPQLSPPHQALHQQRLPSTSPAMATMNREQKLTQWRTILQHL